jgi:inositol phosphorylceramide mannosyltransferase catalytic subunit
LPANASHSLYADLDIECLRSSDELFEIYNVSTVPHIHASTPWTNSDLSSGRKAFFGRMGTDNSFEHSIPNAWMASTPGHPFFLLVLESVNKIIMEGGGDQDPELVTGPIALLRTVNEYQNGDYSGNQFDELISAGPFRKLYGPQQRMKHAVELLPFQYIYPYSWHRDGDAYRSVCWPPMPTFDPARCKQLLGTDHWPSYTISYWSHSWSKTSHDEENLHAID